MSCGYLYTSYGRLHLEEAFRSLESLREVDKDADVTLITTGNIGRDYPFEKFNRYITSPHLCSEFLGGKVERMHSFYDKTIYLDTDTYICESPRPLFDLLGAYDVVVAPDPGEVEVNGLVAPNTGVIAFWANVRTERMLELYRKYYFEKELWRDHPGRRQRTDQPAFAQALRDSNVKTLWIPSNWNFRYRFPSQLHKGTVKIIHGLDCDFQKIQKAANETLEPRCWNHKREEIC
jgi:hypothetical protein